MLLKYILMVYFAFCQRHTVDSFVFCWTQNGVGFVGSGEPRILPTNNIFQKTLNKQIGKTIASNIHAYVFSNPQKFISTIINESTVSH